MSLFSCAVLYTRTVKRRSFLKTILSSLVAAPFLAGGYGWASAYSFEISKHSFKMPFLQKPLKVVHMTDLHFGKFMFEREVRAWVNAANLEQPDLIVITGDIIDHALENKKLESLALELGNLKAPLGVFATLGNHDYYTASGARFDANILIGHLERAGIKYLVNQGVSLRPDFFLAGVDDYWAGTVRVAKSIQAAAPNTALMLLSHNPDILPKVPVRVGLMLSGHTHGGQVRAPFGRGLACISKHGERYQMGFVKEATTAFVSRGLGTSGIPIRTFCPAELVVLELLPNF
jgi:uncharacterized protein